MILVAWLICQQKLHCPSLSGCWLFASWIPWPALYLRPQDYVSLGIPAKIYDWIFSWWAKKILMVGTFSNSWNPKNRWRESIPNWKNVFRIGGNTFYNWKNKILMKIPEFKRSRIGLIAEFRRITNRFPNQGHRHPWWQYVTYASSCIMTMASCGYCLQCTLLCATFRRVLTLRTA